ncbi:MAG: tetratricopeptide repeat protein [Chloroflexi bacterium]|nr:tetratricopeptide repeat protein [Chloroflexota bacterium]
MSYDLDAYQEAMRAGHAFAWDLKWEAASRQYRIALAERPGDPAATLNLAVALERMGQLDEAREMYEEAHRLLPDHAPVLASLIEIQQRLGDMSAAATSSARLARLYLLQGQPSRAGEVARRLPELPLPDPRDLHSLAEAAEQSGASEVLAIIRELLAHAGTESPAADGAGTETEQSDDLPAVAPAAPTAAVRAAERDTVPEPVERLLAAIATANDAGPTVLVPEVDWCPVPSDLQRVSTETRAALARALFESDRERRARQHYAAIDTLWDAIGHSPDFLPVHIQLARVEAARGEDTRAEWRLQTVAELYETEHRYREAAAVWSELGLLVKEPEEVDDRVVVLLLRDNAADLAIARLEHAARRALARGDLDAAISRLDRAIEAVPGAISTGLWRARLLHDRGRSPEAVQWIDQALATAGDPATVAALAVAKIALWAEEERWTEIHRALDEYSTEIEGVGPAVLAEAAAWGLLQGDSAARCYLAGRLLAWAGEIPLAEQVFQSALAMPNVDAAALHLALARLAIARDNWRATTPWLLACLESPGGEAGAIEQALELLREAGDRLSDDRLRARALAGLLGRHPDRLALRPLLAEILLRLGDPAGAREQLRQYAEGCDRSGEPVRALAADEVAAAIQPPDPAALLRLGQRAGRLGYLDTAIAALERVVEMESPAGSSGLAGSALRSLIELARERYPARVTSYLERLAAVEPADAEAHRALIRLYLREGRSRRALQQMESLAAVLDSTGRQAEAAACLREALAIEPWNESLRLALVHVSASGSAAAEEYPNAQGEDR